MSTNGRSRTWRLADVRTSMLRAAVSVLTIARDSAVDEDSGALFRLNELLARAEDEANVAAEALARAERDL